MSPIFAARLCQHQRLHNVMPVQYPHNAGRFQDRDTADIIPYHDVQPLTELALQVRRK